jgi:hypothetical protein
MLLSYSDSSCPGTASPFPPLSVSFPSPRFVSSPLQRRHSIPSLTSSAYLHASSFQLPRTRTPSLLPYISLTPSSLSFGMRGRHRNGASVFRLRRALDDDISRRAPGGEGDDNGRRPLADGPLQGSTRPWRRFHSWLHSCQRFLHWRRSW